MQSVCIRVHLVSVKTVYIYETFHIRVGVKSVLKFQTSCKVRLVCSLGTINLDSSVAGIGSSAEDKLPCTLYFLSMAYTFFERAVFS